MFIAYIITAAIAFLFGRLASDTTARVLGAFFAGVVSMIVLSLFKAEVVGSAVSQAAGDSTTAGTGIDVMGAAIGAFAFWQGSLFSKPKSGDAEA